MIAIDTNVLVRYIVQDDPAQAAAATRFFEDELTVETPGFVPSLVLAELVWVLAHGYRYSRAQIADVVEHTLAVGVLTHERPDASLRALSGYRSLGVDFADALILEIAAEAGAAALVTFDRRLAKLPMARLL
jgi:predicted nucleic-acid-binding protein